MQANGGTSSSTSSTGVGLHGPAVLGQRAADLLPVPSLVDIARLVVQPPSAAQDYNPFLSQQSCVNLQQAVLEWLKLCVLVRRMLSCRTHATAHHHAAPAMSSCAWLSCYVCAGGQTEAHTSTAGCSCCWGRRTANSDTGMFVSMRPGTEISCQI